MELDEVVYSAEMPNDPRFDGLQSRIKKLEEAPTSAKTEGRVKKLLPYLALAVAVVVLLFGNGIASSIFTPKINELIDAKLKQPSADLRQLQLEVKGIAVKLDTFVDLGKDKLSKLSVLTPQDEIGSCLKSQKLCVLLKL